jgi:hypothetical protein
MDQPCFVCGDASPDVRPAYFRVVGATNLGVAAYVRWTNYRIPCCEDCFRRGSAITRTRLRAVGLWVLAPLVVILVAYAVLHLAFRNDEALIGVLMVTGLLWMCGFVVLPVYLSRMSRWRIPEFLGPERDAQLRALSGLRSWGAGRHLVVLREIPKRETFVDLT